MNKVTHQRLAPVSVLCLTIIFAQIPRSRSVLDAQLITTDTFDPALTSAAAPNQTAAAPTIVINRWNTPLVPASKHAPPDANGTHARIIGGLRKNIQALRKNKKTDLIFLIDASSSVGIKNFRSELKFVRKFLNDFNVSYNFTRVAIVSFSSIGKVFRHVDHISTPTKDNDKCNLLHNEMKSIKFSGGGTYTFGALEEAKRIVDKSRKHTKKVILLITDGYSNGPNPVPLAEEMKSQNISIVTFGINTGNSDELQRMSSQPYMENSFLMDSYDMFERLSRKSLHSDSKKGQHIFKNQTFCDHTCQSEVDSSGKEGGCCDDNASCSCGTSSGHYSCVCNEGYYGSGLKGSCEFCPNGTYWHSWNLCKPCPDANHIILAFPARNVSECVCKSGFVSNSYNSKCEGIVCPALPVPLNGYFMTNRNGCGNVINTACGARCRSGYQLEGSSIRMCQQNGSWSGAETMCSLKTCPSLEIPISGVAVCKNPDLDLQVEISRSNQTLNSSLDPMPIDTECTFKCDTGLSLIGSAVRNCLPLSKWDGLPTTCKEMFCDPLPSPTMFGEYYPSTCSTAKTIHSDVCTLICPAGFTVKGPKSKKCQGKRTGTWSNKNKVPKCIDTEPPILTCPANYSLPLNSSNFIIVDTIPPSVATDNSGKTTTPWSTPAIGPGGVRLYEGNHTFTYTTVDSFKNNASCEFTIRVVDTSPPVIENCVNQTVLLPPHCSQANATSPACTIAWDEPIIYDNSNKFVSVDVRPPTARIDGVGTHQILYIATDLANHTSTCHMNVSVEYEQCKSIAQPDHGDLRCLSNATHSVCEINCHSGYALLDVVSNELQPNVTLLCDHKFAIWRNYEIAECTQVKPQPDGTAGGELLSFEINADPNVCSNTTHLQLVMKELSKNLCQFDEHCEIVPDEGLNCTTVEGGDSRQSTDAQKLQYKVTKREAPANAIRHSGIRPKISVPFRIQRTKKANSTTFGERIQELSPTMIDNLKHLNISVTVVVKCSEGSVKVRSKCVQCPRGTHRKPHENRCESCSIGYYSAQPGQSDCIKCPLNHSTRRIGSRLRNDCKQYCPPGTISRKKINRRQPQPTNHTMYTFMPFCHKCPLDHFQPDYNQIVCQKCPEDHTAPRGSTSPGDCVPKFKQCSSNPCGLNGICHQSGPSNLYTCHCNNGFVGSHCEYQLDPCLSGPCFNSGICIANGTQFECRCPTEYEGDLCEGTVSKCLTTACQNNGTCNETNGEVECSCQPGFGGVLCELNFCREARCEYGDCVVSQSGYYCQCHPGFIGRRCHLQPCDYVPCPSTMVCSNLDVQPTRRSSFVCRCPEGFEGDDCSVKVKACARNPCLNNGECVESETGATYPVVGLLTTSAKYYCDCPAYFFGRHCERLITPDFVLNFSNSGTEDYVEMPGPNRDLNEISTCWWIKSNDTFNYGTVISYATDTADNMFTVTDYNGLVIYVNGSNVITDILLTDDVWHFVCVSWMSADGFYEIYLDGFLEKSGFNLSAGHTIEGRGSLMLGQDQDSVGTELSAIEAYVGQMAYLDIWDRFLTAHEVRDMFTSCEPIQGNLYAWSSFKLNIHGSVKIEESQFCQMCEQNLDLKNGYIRYVDKKAFYLCYQGFKLEGAAYRECLRTSVWSEPEPVCLRISCTDLHPIKNGFVKDMHSNRVTYGCYDGFKMAGPSSRECSANGSWMGPQPECTAYTTCSRFQELMIYTVTYASERGPIAAQLAEYPVGTFAEFQCQGNMSIVGESLLTCLGNNNWDYPIPLCARERV